MKRRNVKSTAPFACVLALAASGLTCGSDEPKTARDYRRQAAAAYEAKDYAAALEDLDRALAMIPDHPTLLYNLGAVSALLGRKAESLAYLSRVAQMGLVRHPERDPDFDSIKDSTEFKAILKRFEENRTPVIHSQTAFTIREKGLITEGLAYDPVDRAFFVGSARQRKILRVGRSGDVETLATEKDGLWSVMGMKVDARRRLLWATTTAFPEMIHFNEDEEGRSAVIRLDLGAGTPIRRYPAPDTPGPHALGDLTLRSNGDVFATDSLTPAVYVVRHGHDGMELFLEHDGFVSPQGLAFSDDEHHLFVADYSTGLFDIDMATEEVAHLPPLAGATLLGIDGLYFHAGSLIGVQNGVTPQRVIRIRLSGDLKRAERLEVLEANNPLFDEPTLGVLVEGAFYFIANSQWRLVDEKGRLAPAEELRDPLVLRINL